MSDSELLRFAVESGMLDTALVQAKMDMTKRAKILSQHPYSIWEGKQDGKWYTYLPDTKKGRILKKRTSQKEIEDLVFNYWKEKEVCPTIEEIFHEWNDFRFEIGKISDATYLRNKQVYNRHFDGFGKRKIKYVSEMDWEEFLQREICQKKLTIKAFANLKTLVRGIVTRSRKKELIKYTADDVIGGLDLTREDFDVVLKEDAQEVFMDSELPQTLEYLIQHPDMHNLGILLMLTTGLRVGELVSIKYSDFSSDGRVMKVSKTETRYLDANGRYTCQVKNKPKTQAGIRNVIIPEDYAWIYKRLRTLNPFGEYVFEVNGERLTCQAIRMRMKRVCKKIGIVHKSPHKARKTYASILLDSGIDENMIIGQMGHTDIKCTERHYHRNRKGLERKMELIDQIPEFCAKQKVIS